MQEIGNNIGENEIVASYVALPTLKRFHECTAQYRAIVGPLGSLKTTALAWEIGFFLPRYLYETYGTKISRWCVVRNTYRELEDTTKDNICHDQFPFGKEDKANNKYIIEWPDYRIRVEILFRSCDRKADVSKFRSLNLTGYAIDESIEVMEDVKLTLSGRIGRYPKKIDALQWYHEKFGEKTKWRDKKGFEDIPIPKFGIEVTNPPDIEHPLYSNYAWDTPPPGPTPSGTPLKNHVGFWQPPYENVANLGHGYYDDLRNRYANNQDWIDRYIEGRPGVMMEGRNVYNNFRREYHVAKQPLVWPKGTTLYRGWDNTGNCPACVVVIIPTAGSVHVLKEFHTERMGIVDFSQYVIGECNLLYPDGKYVDYADPAGSAEFSKKEGGFTSNAKLMREECGIDVIPSEQNFEARKGSVDGQLAKIDGMLIDPNCTRIIDGFIGGYHYPEINASRGQYSRDPSKNKYSHIHDSLQYVLVKLIGNAKAKSIDKKNFRMFNDTFSQRMV